MKYKLKFLLNEYILLGIVAVIYILIFSSWNTPYGGDTAIFQTIGKYWAKGDIPYADLWDLKGPIIFFIKILR